MINWERKEELKAFNKLKKKLLYKNHASRYICRKRNMNSTETDLKLKLRRFYYNQMIRGSCSQFPTLVEEPFLWRKNTIVTNCKSLQLSHGAQHLVSRIATW
uniref:Uncharacterized protein n=1 Tax=Phlebotomus papatasi TaxID=29031 RepID=A0A1B0DPS9_PHLPP